MLRWTKRRTKVELHDFETMNDESSLSGTCSVQMERKMERIQCPLVAANAEKLTSNDQISRPTDLSSSVMISLSVVIVLFF